MLEAIAVWALQLSLHPIAPSLVLPLPQPGPRVGVPTPPLLSPQASPSPIPQAVESLARSMTVRLVGAEAAGSGVIIRREGPIYMVLTNWHVVSLGNGLPVVLTPDGKRYRLGRVRQVGRADLAIAQFRSELSYPVVAIAPAIQVGDPVYAAGFPMFRPGTIVNTLKLGVSNLRVSPGQVTMQLGKPLDQGYGLGYSADVVVGMSGGPIFDSLGRLVGVNGRVKDRDPAFGAYVFADGSEPDAGLMEQIARVSWGIAIDPLMLRQL